MRTVMGIVLTATCVFAQSADAANIDYPIRPVHIVVPYAPGGSTDVYARLIAAKTGERLKQSFIVENKPGGNAIIGGEFVARSAPDGYTLLNIGGSNYSSVFTKNSPIDILKDFAPVSSAYYGAFFLLVSSSVPAKSVEEFIAYAKANNGKLNSSSAANTSMLAMEMFNKAVGIQMVHIPYKGASPAAVALANGEVQATMNLITSYRSFIDSGKIRALAVTADERIPSEPQVPTLAQAGIKGMQVMYNNGIWAPSGTPPAIVDKLNGAIVEAVNQSEVRDTIQKGGLTARSSTPEAFRQAIQSEIEFWARAAKAVGYVPQ